MWFIARTANPEEAYDSVFYTVVWMAREHCRNLVGNGWPGYEVHEAVVTMAAGTPGPATDHVCSLDRIIPMATPNTGGVCPDCGRLFRGAFPATPGPDASRLLAAAKGISRSMDSMERHRWEAPAPHGWAELRACLDVFLDEAAAKGGGG